MYSGDTRWKNFFRNPACCGLIGWSLTDSEAIDFLDIMTSEDRKTVLKHYNILLGGGQVPNPHTVRIRRADGEQKFVEIAPSLIQYRNRPAVLAIMRDITERKLEEEALRESEEKIARSRKMESLGLLAGGVAHDLNNVLSGIVSYPRLILMDLPEESKLKKPIKTMQKSGHRALLSCPGSVNHGKRSGYHKRTSEVK
ncbi:MAG: PAS domain S-box protein [Thermodesulfobacteriota bacterium]|nr:PAS domain S-box protein [Thermodesulfobacteriota bacterium]